MDYSAHLPYQFGFGVDEDDPLQMNLEEPLRLLDDLVKVGASMINLTCGSPYYNPHAQRPAFFPPSDGYQPPEDPLTGVFRQIEAVRICKRRFPQIPMVGTGYTYLQEYLPQVAQALVRDGWVDFVGLGRMVLSYPELPADTLSSGEMNRRLICRTFSDCTTAPRNGMVSGCFPLDAHYKQMPEADTVKSLKKQMRTS